MTDTRTPTRTDRRLGGIERVGNRIPEPFLPFTVFFRLASAGVLALWFFLDLPFGPGKYARPTP